MKEYALSTILVICLAFCLDIYLKTHVSATKKFWLFQSLGLVLTALVDHASASYRIVLYNSTYVSPVRIYNVPLEHFLFGFSMLYINIIIFERLRRKNTHK